MGQSSSFGQRSIFETLILGLLVVLIILLMAATVLRIVMLNQTIERISDLDNLTPAEGEVTQEQANDLLTKAELVLARADDAVNSTNLILSFLEGGSVLVGLALGGAALYGYRTAQDNQDKLDKYQEKLTAEMGKLEALRLEIIQYQPFIVRLPQDLERIEGIEDRIWGDIDKDLLPNVNDLLQAYQELNLKNYTEAHRYTLEVLKRSGDRPNPLALYLAGWMELQYIPHQLDIGLEHLQTAIQLRPEALSFKAAYAVGLRRKARNEDNADQRELLWTEALVNLRAALDKDPNLIDLNRESFWGPLAGTYRDLKNPDKAIECYKKALDVTPNSSYPLGNLAALYMQKSQSDPHYLDEALKIFQQTIDSAKSEVAWTPRDYYPMMDVAMAYTMLSNKNAANSEQALEWFDKALKMNPASGMLKVSLGGWRHLLTYCPQDWGGVREQLQGAIEHMEAVLDELRVTASQPAAE